MSIEWKADALLANRPTQVGRYKPGHLVSVACELRFPTVLELGERKPHPKVVNALRRHFPNMEVANHVQFGSNGPLTSDAFMHIFRSSDTRWGVFVTQNTLSVETMMYSGFDAFSKRVMSVFNLLVDVMDTDILTRVGMRYINVVNPPNGTFEGLINSALISPLLSGNFGGISEYAGKLNLAAEDGGCILQHGLQQRVATSQTYIPAYLLDVDVFRKDVSVADVTHAMNSVHMQACQLFDWAAGPLLRADT